MDDIVVNDLDKELERLENFGEVIGTAVVNRNGLLISSRLPRDIDERRLSALAATMFQAMETATLNLDNNQIKNITVVYQDYQIIVLEVNEKSILVCLIDINDNLGLIS
jgi:predicted regulator of Ras-like GTPase activity (Roadblock/LC7/MglB family)